MRILILGIGDAFTRLHFSSGALVEAPGGYVLVDCPDLIHRVLLEGTRKAGWGVDAADPWLSDIIVTHLHGDHCNGLESFGFKRRMLRAARPDLPRPRLHVSRPVAQRLWERLAPAMHPPMGQHSGASTLDDFYDVHILEPGQPAQVAGLAVQCRFTKHPVPTIGLLLSDGRRTFGWSSDTPFDQAHVDWLNQADVFVHESNTGAAHTPIESLNGLPPAVRKKIHLIHLPDDFDPAVTDMAVLKQGDVITL